MAERTHTNPNGSERFKILVQLSHVNLGIFRRDYAGITIFREAFERTSFNFFDPSTWFGTGRFVRAGNPSTIATGAGFLNAAGNDISGSLNLTATDRTGHFGRSTLFIFLGSPMPTDLGNDARSVRRVHLDYLLPWEDSARSLDQS